MMKNKKIENIIETAIINNKTDFKYDVWVNGGKYYYINETSEPHFYFSEDIYNKKITMNVASQKTTIIKLTRENLQWYCKFF